MNSKRAKWWVPTVVTALTFLRSVFAPVYDLTFGRIDRRLAKKDQERLANDIELAFRFLFEAQKGRIVPNHGLPFPPGFDYAFVTIEISNMLLRFTRGRGVVGVQVAPVLAPSDWHDLSLVLSAIGGQSEIQRREFDNL